MSIRLLECQSTGINTSESWLWLLKESVSHEVLEQWRHPNLLTPASQNEKV